MYGQSIESGARGRTEPSSLWNRILAMIEEDLSGRRTTRHFVEVTGEFGPCHKEIGDLSTEERHSLHPAMREQIAERLLDRYLAEQNRVDLADKRHAYTKRLEDLTPEDLPALAEADRWRVEEEREKERERAEFVREARGPRPSHRHRACRNGEGGAAMIEETEISRTVKSPIASRISSIHDSLFAPHTESG